MDGDLDIFRGMEGFEDCNGSDDSAIAALLDDLQDETLMTLLNDDLFVREVCDNPFEPTHGDSSYSDQGSLFVSDVACSETIQSAGSFVKRNYSGSGVVLTEFSDGNKRIRNDSVQESGQKRLKMESSAEQPRSLMRDCDATLANVLHDHCYTLSNEACRSPYHSNTNSDEEASNEEGSSSDTGKHTIHIPCH